MDVQACNARLDLVSASYPDTELLAEACHLLDTAGGDVNMDQNKEPTLWQVDLANWKRFCEACGRLTALNWQEMPFATAFFEAFGDHLKPHLTKLTLGVAKQWKWDSYLRQVNAETKDALVARGYATSAKNLQAVFRACPQLRVLTINVDPRQRCEDENLLDVTVFNGAFWNSLVRSCPLLESLAVRQHGFERVVMVDDAVHALASLSRLCFVRLDFVEISGDALFELILQHTENSPRERVFEITPSGGDHREMQFYVTLLTFLTRLADYKGSEPPYGSRRVRLRLINVTVNEVLDRPAYCRQVCGVAQRIQAKYPTLLLQGFLNFLDQKTGNFGTVDEFTLVTHPMSSDRSEKESQVGKDGVFVVREGDVIHASAYFERGVLFFEEGVDDDDPNKPVDTLQRQLQCISEQWSP